MLNQRVRFAVIMIALIVWAGCSSPTRPAEVVPAPVLPIVPDLRPAAGTHPYRLSLQFPPCLDGRNELVSDPKRLNYAFDYDLIVQGPSLQMTLRDGNRWGQVGIPPLTLTIQRAGQQLSGTIGGLTFVDAGPYKQYTQLALWRDRANRPGVRWEERGDRGQIPSFTGTADNEGKLTGSFDGYFQVTYLSSGWFDCAVQGATFTLEPLS